MSARSFWIGEAPCLGRKEGREAGRKEGRREGERKKKVSVCKPN